jgi:GNAT superfamily N-acetyltransferase
MLNYMRNTDVPMVVSVHLQSFPAFFLSTLGPKFLSLYYHGVVDAPEGIAFVYLNEAENPAGFVAGSSNPRGFYKQLLKRDWLKFSFASIGTLLRTPRAVKRVARALLHPDKNPVGEGVAGLFSIGVLPELQGTGAGKALVAAFLDEARKRGCSKVFLTTDRDDNHSVNQFYEKLGFAVEREYVTPEGRNMNEYWITLH